MTDWGPAFILMEGNRIRQIIVLLSPKVTDSGLILNFLNPKSVPVKANRTIKHKINLKLASPSKI
jgi:hypothetical protein